MEALVSTTTPEGPLSEWMIGNVDQVGVVEQQHIKFDPITKEESEDVKDGESLEYEKDEDVDGSEIPAEFCMTTRSRVRSPRPKTFFMVPTMISQQVVSIDEKVSFL